MYNEQLEQLIDAALADGELTEKEKQILFKKAQSMGVDLDEFEMVLDARLVKLKKAEAEKAASSAPKSNKLGDVKKCPACGAMVQSYQGVCPECGYAFEGIDTNSAVKELSNLLQKTSDQGQMEMLINNYPIPMEKASLLAFVTWLRPQSTDLKNPLAKSYQKKYEECINKIRVSFSNDKELQSFIALYQEDEKKIKKQKISKLTLKNKWFWIGVGVLFVLVLIFKPKPISKNPEKCNAMIIKEIDKGNLNKAYEYASGFKYNYKRPGVPEVLAPGIIALTEAYLKEGMIEKAEHVGYGTADVILFQFFLAQDNLEKAEEYAIGQNIKILEKTYLDKGYYDEYMKYADFHSKGEYIKDVVVHLCEQGRNDEARRFLNSQCVGISSYDNLYIQGNGDPTKYVKKIIQDIINTY